MASSASNVIGGMQITSFVSSRSEDITFLRAFTSSRSSSSKMTAVAGGLDDDNHKRKCGQLRTTSHRKYHHHHHHQQQQQQHHEGVNRKRRKLMKGTTTEGPICRRYRRRRNHMLVSHTNSSTINGDAGDGETIKWLMTHLWHRKRMIMATLWGYCIPIRSSQYSFNNNMLKRGAIACDRSFIRPIQLTTAGGVQDMLCILSRFLDPSTSFLSLPKAEPREFETLIYSDGEFPNKCIGPVTITYRPTSSDGNVSVWIWTHPSFFSSFKRELTAAVHETAVDGREVSVVNDVVRFSIRGVSSSVVIKAAMNARASRSGINDNELFYTKIMDSEALPRLWVDGDILAVECRDKRYSTVSKRDASPITEFTEFRYKTGSSRLSWPSNIHSTASTLWNDEYRHKLSAGFVNDCVVHASNSRIREFNWFVEKSAGAPTVNDGDVADTVNEAQREKTFPVLLVRKKALNNRKGHECDRSLYNGWDIIAPSCYASLIWSTLHMCGAKAIGVHDFNDLQTNAGLSTYPRDFVDDDSCKDASNSSKLNIDAGLDIVIVREKRYLKPFDPSAASSNNGKIRAVTGDQNELLLVTTVPRLPKLQMNTLVTVLLTPTCRGVIREGAHIFGSSPSDFVLWRALDSCKGQIVLGRFIETWKGHQNSEKTAHLTSIGVVTSGQQKATRSSRIGIGLCNASTLRDCFRQSLTACYGGMQTQAAPVRTECLVLFQNPSSRALRPALMQIVCVSE